MNNKEIAGLVKILLDKSQDQSLAGKHTLLLQVLVAAALYAFKAEYSPDAFIKSQTQAFDYAMNNIDSIFEELDKLNQSTINITTTLNKDLN
jgi:predicted glycosyl hydrolase (DUF1957 family)